VIDHPEFPARSRDLLPNAADCPPESDKEEHEARPKELFHS
jgi:hypothetical protein